METSQAFLSQHLIDLSGVIDLLENVVELIGCSIVDDPPVNLRDGGVIRSEYNEKLAELRAVASGGKDWIKNFQYEEQQRSGIS